MEEGDMSCKDITCTLFVSGYIFSLRKAIYFSYTNYSLETVELDNYCKSNKSFSIIFKCHLHVYVFVTYVYVCLLFICICLLIMYACVFIHPGIVPVEVRFCCTWGYRCF